MSTFSLTKLSHIPIHVAIISFLPIRYSASETVVSARTSSPERALQVTVNFDVACIAAVVAFPVEEPFTSTVPSESDTEHSVVPMLAHQSTAVDPAFTRAGFGTSDTIGFTVVGVDVDVGVRVGVVGCCAGFG